MLTAQSLRAYLERGFVVGPPTSGRLSVTHEPYVVIGSQHPNEGLPKIIGTVDECCARELAFDEETACMQALACFEAYAEGRGRFLYWRVEPCFETFEQANPPNCTIYMRCLVSDKDWR